MNLQLECQGKVLNFQGVSDLSDLKTRLNSCEPSFLLETLTYVDEDNDVITVSNEEDFACLLTSTINTIQAIGKQEQYFVKTYIQQVPRTDNSSQDTNLAKKEVNNNQIIHQIMDIVNSDHLNYQNVIEISEEEQEEKRLLLQKRLEQKVKFFKEQQKVYLKNRRDLYQSKIDLINSGKKEIKELKIKEKALQQQIPEQQKIIKQNEKIKIKVTPKQDLEKTTIFQDILEAESKITYNQENINHFRNSIYLLELQLCQKFTAAYQIRLDKFVALRQRRKNDLSKLQDIHETLRSIQTQIQSKIKSINKQEIYYTQKLMAVKSLLKKL